MILEKYLATILTWNLNENCSHIEFQHTRWIISWKTLRHVISFRKVLGNNKLTKSVDHVKSRWVFRFKSKVIPNLKNFLLFDIT